MKKSLTKKLKAAFWLVFTLGFLWVAFMPHRTPVPPSITVPVHQPLLPEERHIDAGPPADEPALPVPGPNVTVPVSPLEPAIEHKTARIAVVIDDMGMDSRTSERAIRLPPSVTLSFLPYAVRVRDDAKAARDLGHEILLHLPMEPKGNENPGPDALLVDLPPREILVRLETALASFMGFDGVNNHMGSKFTVFADGMNLVMDELKQRQLFFLDSRTSGESLGMSLAEAKGVPALRRDVFIDDDPSPTAIRKQLELAERIARRKGYAIAIGHPHAATIDAVAGWMQEAPARGIEFVPINVLIQQKRSQP